MERAFIFDKYNTFADWRLILTEKSVAPPEPKTNYIELDGMSGTLDLTEALTGEVAYKDRTVSASFFASEGTRSERTRLIHKIIALLHGKKIKVIEPDDTSHYFYGRAKVDVTTNNLAYAEFTVDIVCEPWRYALEESIRTIDVADTVKSLVINNNGVKTLCPEIDVKGTVNITVDGITTALTTGNYKMTNLKLKSGANVVEVSGNGSVSFVYREADL